MHYKITSMLILRAVMLLIILGFISCDTRKRDKVNLSFLVGDWKSAVELKRDLHTKKIKWQDIGNRGDTYSFYSDSTCDNRYGFYKTVSNAVQEDYIFFLGNKTKYRLEGDSLKIYNPLDSIWDSRVIYSLTSDSLIFKFTDSTFERFYKVKYVISKEKFFDQVFISSSGCYGCCPANNVIINRAGILIFDGIANNSKNGIFTARISESQFNEVETNFKKVNFERLKNHYKSGWTDQDEVIVTFVKDGKIFRTISDYGQASPTEFFWAYEKARYLYQKLQLDTMNGNHFEYGLGDIRFEYNRKFLRLNYVQSICLWNLFTDAKETDVSFIPKYKVKYVGNKNYKKIETDGQIYRFTMQNGISKTYDLGFDFFERNNLNEKFTFEAK